MKKANTIFEHTKCLSEDTLMGYISNKLSPAKKHEVEKHLIDCELCSDAVEGWKMISDKQRINGATSALNQKIQQRTENKGVKIISLLQYRTRFAIAASILLIISLVWFFRNNNAIKELDSRSAEKIFADKFEPPPAENNNEELTPFPDVKEERDSRPILSENKKVVISNKKEDNLSTYKSEEAQIAINTEEKASSTKSAMTTYSEPAVRKKESELLERDKKEAAKPVAAPSITSGAASGAFSPPAQAEGKNMNLESDNISSGKKQRGNYSKRKTKAVSAYDDSESAAITAETASQPARAEKSVLLDSISSGISPASNDLSLSESAPLEDAMARYNRQDYAGAIVDFEQVLKKNPNDEKALFYSGISYLSLTQSDKAIINLTKVMQNKNSKYADDARWYLSLAYIKKNDINNARKNLLELQNNSNSKYQKQADETLREISK